MITSKNSFYPITSVLGEDPVQYRVTSRRGLTSTIARLIQINTDNFNTGVKH